MNQQRKHNGQPYGKQDKQLACPKDYPLGNGYIPVGGICVHRKYNVYDRSADYAAKSRSDDILPRPYGRTDDTAVRSLLPVGDNGIGDKKGHSHDAHKHKALRKDKRGKCVYPSVLIFIDPDLAHAHIRGQHPRKHFGVSSRGVRIQPDALHIGV